MLNILKKENIIAKFLTQGIITDGKHILVNKCNLFHFSDNFDFLHLVTIFVISWTTLQIGIQLFAFSITDGTGHGENVLNFECI